MCEVEYKQGRISIPDKVVWGLIATLITTTLSAIGSGIYLSAELHGAIDKLDALPDAQVIEERYQHQREVNQHLWNRVLNLEQGKWVND